MTDNLTSIQPLHQYIIFTQGPIPEILENIENEIGGFERLSSFQLAILLRPHQSQIMGQHGIRLDSIVYDYRDFLQKAKGAVSCKLMSKVFFVNMYRSEMLISYNEKDPELNIAPDLFYSSKKNLLHNSGMRSKHPRFEKQLKFVQLFFIGLSSFCK